MTTLDRWLLLLHTASTWAMVGLIWFVQIVHYPLMADVGRDGFARYEQLHQRWTGWVVGPLMLTELATTALILWYRPANISAAIAASGAAMLAIIWIGTYLIQVPQHNRLAAGFDSILHQQLVLGNWLRTVVWTCRGVLALWILRASWR